MKHLDLINNQQMNKCYNKDANELITQISGDILYLDPPYNTRQYASNYHLLDTIAKYHQPEIKGVTGLPIQRNKSKFSSKRTVYDALEHLISHANVKHIILSYSTEGILSIDEITEIFRKHCDFNTFKMYKIPYKRFKSNNVKQDTNTLYELLFYAKTSI